MGYSRRTVTDGVTKMNKDLYDNLQDGIDESKQSINALEKKFDGYVPTENLADEVKKVVISDILVI